MLEKLLRDLFNKLENENENDKKTKNGNANYFVEDVLELRFGKPNFISSKAIKGYFDKYVEKKENNAGEPSNELKNLISVYLGYESFLDFESQQKSLPKSSFPVESRLNFSSNKWGILSGSIILLSVLIFGLISLNKEDCIIWEVDHYEKIDCGNNFPNPVLRDIDINTFHKISVSDTTVFFVNGQPTVWYGKSNNGEIEFFNSRGIHPITFKELKPITTYMIGKYVTKSE